MQRRCGRALNGSPCRNRSGRSHAREAVRLDFGWEGQPAPDIQQRLRAVSVRDWNLEARVYHATQNPHRMLLDEAPGRARPANTASYALKEPLHARPSCVRRARGLSLGTPRVKGSPRVGTTRSSRLPSPRNAPDARPRRARDERHAVRRWCVTADSRGKSLRLSSQADSRPGFAKAPIRLPA